MPDFLTSLDNDFLQGGLILMLLGLGIALIRPAIRGAGRVLLSQITVSVHVTDDQGAYDWLAGWLAAQPAAQRARRLVAESRRGVLMFTPAPGLHLLRYRGTFGWVHRTRRSLEAGLARARGDRAHADAMTVRMLGRSPRLLRDLVDEARRQLERPRGEIDVHVLTRDGWRVLHRTAPRPVDSVILPGNLAEDVLADAREFLARRNGIGSAGCRGGEDTSCMARPAPASPASSPRSPASSGSISTSSCSAKR
jgi:mitochondrial chaperone BCS1